MTYHSPEIFRRYTDCPGLEKVMVVNPLPPETVMTAVCGLTRDFTTTSLKVPCEPVARVSGDVADTADSITVVNFVGSITPVPTTSGASETTGETGMFLKSFL